MSKSLRRVTDTLLAHGLHITPQEMPAETRTAQQAADAAACDIDQIAKSIIFAGDAGLVLFITAGSNLVDPAKAQRVAGQKLGRADAAQVRAQTGFAIGGVAPVGHLSPLPCFWDPRLSDFPVVYAAAGTPRHIFAISPADLLTISGAQPADFTALPKKM